MRWSEAQLEAFQRRRGRHAPASHARARGSRKTTPALRFEASETEAHIAVADHLRTRCRREIHWHHPATGERRDIGTSVKLQRMGVRPGLPDFLLLIDGRLHGLELKRDHGGRVSPDQTAMHNELSEAGAVIAVAHGLNEALTVLESWGVFDRQLGD